MIPLTSAEGIKIWQSNLYNSTLNETELYILYRFLLQVIVGL